MWGYQVLHLQDGRRSMQKENALNMCTKEDFIPVTLLIIVALTLKEFRILLQTFKLHVNC